MSESPEKVVSMLNLDEVRERVRAVQEAEGISQSAIASEAGISGATLSQFLAGSYGGDNNKVAGKLIIWLNQREQSAEMAAVMPQAPTWIETPTSKKIFTALQYAQIAGDIAVIYGGAGLSKTTTIRRYRQQAPNVWVVTATPATASVGVLLEEIAEALGLRNQPLHPAKLQRAIVRQISDTRGLLIIDEAQHLTKQALEAARSIHDATGVGLALSGNAAVFNRLYGGGNNGFAQLYSRVGKRVALVRPVAGDVHAIAAAFSVRGKDERLALEEIGKKPGALRMVVKVLRLAAVAAGGGEAIRTAHINGAWTELQGEPIGMEAPNA